MSLLFAGEARFSFVNLFFLSIRKILTFRIFYTTTLLSNVRDVIPVHVLVPMQYHKTEKEVRMSALGNESVWTST